MNRRRQFFSTIGLGFLLAGGAAAVPREELAAAAKPHRIQAARGHGRHDRQGLRPMMELLPAC